MISVLIGAVVAFSAWAAILASASGSRTTTAHYAVPLLMSSMIVLVFWRALVAVWQTRPLASADGLPHIYASTGGDANGGGKDEPPGDARQPTFEELFPIRKTTAYVMDILRRLGVRREHRDDMCQKVMLAAFESFARFDPEKLPTYRHGRFPPHYRWINRIAVHVAAHYHKVRGGGPGDPEPDDPDDLIGRQPDPTPLADEVIATYQHSDVLTSNVWRLLHNVIPDPVIRECVIDHHMYGHQIKDIADREGIAPSTMYKKAAQAMRVLREVLQAYPGEPVHRVKTFLSEQYQEWWSG